jgi:putative toxin-antitoxin system antitoxin component (TIGR02293 family)
MTMETIPSPAGRESALTSLRSEFEGGVGRIEITQLPAQVIKARAKSRVSKSTKGSIIFGGGLHNLTAYRIVKGGISSRALIPFGEYLGLGKGEVAEFLDLDRTTVHRKVLKDEPLPIHAAETMLRLLELSSLAEETLATAEEAAAWLRRPHPMLDGEAPLECAKSSFGAQRVRDMLVTMKYGGVV